MTLRAFLLGGILSLSILSFSTSVHPSLSKEDSWQAGKELLAEGKAKAAKELVQNLLEKYPRNADLHFFFALASMRQGKVQDAEPHVRRALDLAPNHVEAGTLLGWINLEVRKDFPSAITAYSQVVTLRSRSAQAHNNLGVALSRNGDWEKAVKSFNQALDLKGDYAEAWSNRGWAFLRQEKWREAHRDFEQALKRNSEDEGALYGLSQVRWKTRDYAGAQKALGTLITQRPNFIYWLEWFELGLVRYYWGLLLVAVALFARNRYKNRMRSKAHGG